MSRADALRFLSQDPVRYVDMAEVIRRDTAEILAAGPDGILLRETCSDAYMAAPATEAAGLALLGAIPEGAQLIAAHAPCPTEAIARRFGLSRQMACHQAAYLDRCAPQVPPLPYAIRPVAPADAGTVLALYGQHTTPAYVGGRIAAGEMLGAYDGARLCGFVGLHEEGSMGMMEVDPAYRRQRIGYALAASMIGMQLARGRTPFSQFLTTNDASRRLHEALGMRISPHLVTWLD